MKKNHKLLASIMPFFFFNKLNRGNLNLNFLPIERELSLFTLCILVK